ncbi:MAG: hypothetical protein EXQ84_07945 [Rhodospirillaceae bacterium]|nr:hypothetical protein [Rhodospirillaceae bacterium]
MSTAQVANSGMIGATARVSHGRSAVASSTPFVEPLSGAYAPPARDQTPVFDEDFEEFAAPRRRRRVYRAPFQDGVVSFGGVLVSREIGTMMMHAQAATSLRSAPPVAAEAERSVAIYEFNQALMGAAETTTDIGFLR